MLFFFKQKTAYEMRISDWSSDVCSSDLCIVALYGATRQARECRQLDALRAGLLLNIKRQCALYVVGAHAYPHFQKSTPSCINCRDSTILCTSDAPSTRRSEEHPSELQSLMLTSYAVFCLNKQTHNKTTIARSNL